MITAVAPEGFASCFGSDADTVTEGVCTLASDFLSLLWDVERCLLLQDPYLLSWDGFLEIRVKKCGQKLGTYDISGKHVVLNVDRIWNSESRELDPTSILKII